MLAGGDVQAPVGILHPPHERDPARVFAISAVERDASPTVFICRDLDAHEAQAVFVKHLREHLV